MAELGTARPQHAELVRDLGEGARRLRVALERGTSRTPAEEFLSGVAARLDPNGRDVADMQDRTLVLLLRPLAVDLLQASGLPEDAALEKLPVLSEDTAEGPPVE